MATAATKLHCWWPNFGEDGNFAETTGMVNALREIFIVLTSKIGSRQWQPRFGCKLLDRLFDANATETELNDDIRYAFSWLPHIELLSVNTIISPMIDGQGRKAEINMRISYEDNEQNFQLLIPSNVNLLNGALYQIKVM